MARSSTCRRRCGRPLARAWMGSAASTSSQPSATSTTLVPGTLTWTESSGFCATTAPSGGIASSRHSSGPSPAGCSDCDSTPSDDPCLLAGALAVGILSQRAADLEVRYPTFGAVARHDLVAVVILIEDDG